MVMHPHTKYHWPLERNNYLTLRSKVKVQTKVIMVHDTSLMVMHPHTKYHWPISKDKKCYGPNKKILFKKQLFDLEVKGQGPDKLRWEEAEEKNQTKTYISPFVRRGDIIKIHI
jgi:hypothetical protein